MGSRDLQEVIETCEQLGITIGPIASMHDVAENPHYRERQSVVNITGPGHRTPPENTQCAVSTARRPRGAFASRGCRWVRQTTVIYRDLLGYSGGLQDAVRQMI
ncbi:MAG: CoA transferase [Desulfobacterales bacterium]|nr:CoA transferase [Desulfobacterales bacterium]